MREKLATNLHFQGIFRICCQISKLSTWILRTLLQPAIITVAMTAVSMMAAVTIAASYNASFIPTLRFYQRLSHKEQKNSDNVYYSL